MKVEMTKRPRCKDAVLKLSRYESAGGWLCGCINKNPPKIDPCDVIVICIKREDQVGTTAKDYLRLHAIEALAISSIISDGCEEILFHGLELSSIPNPDDSIKKLTQFQNIAIKNMEKKHGF